MDMGKNNKKDIVTVWSEKLYTQNEVDSLLEKNKKSSLSLSNNIVDEAKTANERKRHNDTAVANLISRSNRILVSIRTHAFPFDFIPDIINIEEGRITIIRRHIFSSEVHSIDIKDISNIFINRTFLFSQLVIISKTYENNEVRIKNLKTNEAIHVRRIVEGLRVFIDKKIETHNYTIKELVAKLEELSTTKIVM